MSKVSKVLKRIKVAIDYLSISECPSSTQSIGVLAAGYEIISMLSNCGAPISGDRETKDIMHNVYNLLTEVEEQMGGSYVL